jgi:ribosomal-protein-alanine N-acetyltransferase
VARAHRRQGLGWRLMDAVLRELHGQRAEALFLEVDETNTAAIALYRRLGFFEVGKRPSYYESAQGSTQDKSGALVMRRDLR